VQVLASLDQLGSDDHYIKLQGNWDKAVTFGRNSLNLGLMGGTNLADGDLPPYDQLILGGFLRLSGYRPEQLRGQELAFARVIYHRRLTELPTALGSALYAGGSLEAGNAWDGKTDIPDQGIKAGGSVFIGADTILGPLYLGYGYASHRNNSLYLLVGKP
jgi:NTE family protein